jgi:hypothetical protein
MLLRHASCQVSNLHGTIGSKGRAFPLIAGGRRLGKTAQFTVYLSEGKTFQSI